MEKKRSKYIDVLRGGAILLVVIGHSIQYNYLETFDSIFLFRIIYSFHMPFFMALSGSLAFSTFDDSIDKLKKRSIALVVPFISWLLIRYVYLITLNQELDLSVFLINVILSPDNGGLWFLWVLFLEYLLLFFILKFNSKWWAFVIIGITSQVLPYITPYSNFMGFYLLKLYFPYFILGFLFNKFKSQLINWLVIGQIISLILFPLLVFFWQRNDSSIFINMFSLNNSGMIKLLKMAYDFTIGIFGILFFSFLMKYLSRLSYSQALLIFLGSITLEIYAIHYYFIDLAIYIIRKFYFYNTAFLKCSFTVIFSLLSVYFIIKLIKRNKMLSFYLFAK